jgi:hypothetical protein
MHLVIKSHFIFINQTNVHLHKTCRWSNCLICYSTHHQNLVGLVDPVFVYLGYYLSAVPHVGRRLPVSRLPWLLSLCCPSCWPSSLLGDSAYWLKPWLLTPVLSPSTAKERKYNTAHTSTRSVIERTHGIWRIRFHCLYRALTLSPIRNLNVVLATAGLHNKCIDRRIPLPTEDFEMNE